jgi:hypothetical protein
MAGNAWKPIEGLSDAERTLLMGSMRPLYESWWASKQRLQESSGAQLAEFNRKLIRRLSVETGILERLYDLDRGTTEALVANGFLEDLVSRASTNLEPAGLIDILRDHEAAIQLVIDCVTNKRTLTKGLIHELHAILAWHQHSTIAVDPLGKRLEIPLLKGKFKEQPNNPRRPGGGLHEYCPPIHVESEIDRLLACLGEYDKEDPIVVAAWLHHRFTQIHPYQDGNGRVARALTTLVLLRAGLLPLVVDRDLRTGYIHALELADQSQLRPLTEIFARLEQKAILQALSIDVDPATSQRERLTAAVVESLADKFAKRKLQKLAELRSVNGIAVALRQQARSFLDRSLTELSSALRELGTPKISISDGGPDHGNAYWYKHQVAQSASLAGKFANFAEDHYFVNGQIIVNSEKLSFIVSFHHVGRELTGIMEATAFSQLDSHQNEKQPSASANAVSLCSVEPFVFAQTTMITEIADAFDRWLDVSLAIAMKEFGDRL